MNTPTTQRTVEEIAKELFLSSPDVKMIADALTAERDIAEGLRKEVEEARKILESALSDDSFNDHSSGIWQEKAEQLLTKLNQTEGKEGDK
jgi:DNA-directed RNA polymerase sigma subunit (sigma70/sigma32)